MGQGHGWWQRWREARALRRRAIPDALWRQTLRRYPFLRRKSADDEAALRRMAALFLDRKEFSGAHGLAVSDTMAVAVAAQACLPVLRLGLQLYDGFVGIVMHRDEVVAPREITDEAGVVHRYGELLTGEAMDGGPMMLSWRDVAGAGASAERGYNVVIHEFIHVLDMADGAADGAPPFADRFSRTRWLQVMESEYAGFTRIVDAGDTTVLDPYGAQGIDEFFAVAAEMFFANPTAMQSEHPRLYAAFAAYFKQDPAQEGTGP
jgi:Mlc titration factor MtfA (ptsG expression regulator)